MPRLCLEAAPTSPSPAAWLQVERQAATADGYSVDMMVGAAVNLARLIGQRS
jgi:hypothetical protein